MAGEAVPYICDFSESQKKIFQTLEEEMKNKWNITLRWDSKVPKKDKWFFYFFTLRGLDRKQICQDLKHFETEFGSIFKDMKDIREGKEVSQQKIQSIRERFEVVLEKMKMVLNTTDSSTLYDATSNALAKKEEVLKCFDHVEIIQSRKELPQKKQQLDALRNALIEKDETVRNMFKSYEQIQERERKKFDTIETLESQVRISQQNTVEYREVIDELLRKVEPMLQEGNGDVEDGINLREALKINVSMITALYDVFDLSEESKVREHTRDEKLVNFENRFQDISLQALEELLKLHRIVGEITSSRNKKKNSPDGNCSSEEEPESAGASELSELRHAERNNYLKNQLSDNDDRNKEMRDECKEFMSLISKMLFDSAGSDNRVGKEKIMETVLGINGVIENKVNATLNSFESFKMREVKRDEKIENLEYQLKATSQRILELIESMANMIRFS